MANCDVTKGRNTIACKNAVGGIRNIYLAPMDVYNFTLVTPTGATGSDVPFTITDIGSVSECFQYRLKHTGNVYQQDVTSSSDNGTTTFKPTLTVNLTKVSPEMELQMYLMAISSPIIFVETNGGEVFLMGKDNGVELSGNSQVQGTFDSFNGYQLTFSAEEMHPVYYLTSSAITALKQTVSSSNI